MHQPSCSRLGKRQSARAGISAGSESPWGAPVRGPGPGRAPAGPAARALAPAPAYLECFSKGVLCKRQVPPQSC